MKLLKCNCFLNNASGVIKIKSNCLSKTLIVKLSEDTTELEINEIYNFIKDKLEKHNNNNNKN